MAPSSRTAARARTSVTGSLLTVALLLARPAQAAWRKTAPRGNALPDDRPPASFEGRDNNIFPFGVSDALDDRPALLHSNKFYSNFIVSNFNIFL